MKKEVAKALWQEMHDVADRYSKSDRPNNYANETYEVGEYRILGERSAAVIYDKKPTEKKALAWFYYMTPGSGPKWYHVFLSYDHLTNMEKLREMLYAVEQHNFPKSVNDG